MDCFYSLWSVMCLVACVTLLYLAVFLPVRVRVRVHVCVCVHVL